MTRMILGTLLVDILNDILQCIELIEILMNAWIAYQQNEGN